MSWSTPWIAATNGERRTTDDAAPRSATLEQLKLVTKGLAVHVTQGAVIVERLHQVIKELESESTNLPTEDEET